MIYEVIRNWVDRQWRAPGGQYKVLVLPAILPALVLLPFRQEAIAQISMWGWFALWVTFVAWRYYVFMAEVSGDADREYDLIGKFKLVREYHGTESATGNRERKKKMHD